MEPVLVVSVFLLVSCGVYQLLQASWLRVLLGLGLVSHAFHLILLCAGHLGSRPPLANVGGSAEIMTDPLPQALVLTSIVITMAITLYLLAAIAKGAGWGVRDRVEPPPEADHPRQGEAVLAELEGRSELR
jgi:multicomponent Na+:H+ antiporter subunit C